MKLDRFDVSRVLGFGLKLSAAILCFNLIVLADGSVLSGSYRSFWKANSLEPGHLAVASILLGMGLATQITIFAANSHRLRAVLHPNAGRVVCALVLALCVPGALFGGLPMTFVLPVAEFIASLVMAAPLKPMLWQVVSVFAFLVFPIAYLFSSLITSGITRRWMRVLIFGQVWFAAYGAAILLFGCCRVNL